jgi:hypothetical protein
VTDFSGFLSSGRMRVLFLSPGSVTGVVPDDACTESPNRKGTFRKEFKYAKGPRIW